MTKRTRDTVSFPWFRAQRSRVTAARNTKCRTRKTSSAFTLFEVVLALAILGILTGAVYSVASAAVEVSKATLAGRSSSMRLESFLCVTRNTFLNLPTEGRVHLRFTRSATGSPVPEVVFEDAAGVFGIPSLGGGALVLSARPVADGSRTMSMLRVPKDRQAGSLPPTLPLNGAWIPLLPHVERVKWTFFSHGQWREECLPNSERPLAARLQMDFLDMPGSKIDAQFWIPPLVATGSNGPTPPVPQP